MCYFHRYWTILSASQVVYYISYHIWISLIVSEISTPGVPFSQEHDDRPQQQVEPERCLDNSSMLGRAHTGVGREGWRSEEHTSELQSQSNLVCRLLLEKKKIQTVTERMPHALTH